MISPKARPTLTYGAIVVIGFAVDFCLTLGLSRLAGLRLEAAATIGFIAGLCLNYLMFEFWAFRSDRSQVSPVRFTKTAAAASIALVMRVGVIFLMSRLLGDRAWEAVVMVLAGATASLVVNFILVSNVFAIRD